jgi:hypothetical protein
MDYFMESKLDYFHEEDVFHLTDRTCISQYCFTGLIKSKIPEHFRDEQ